MNLVDSFPKYDLKSPNNFMETQNSIMQTTPKGEITERTRHIFVQEQHVEPEKEKPKPKIIFKEDS